MRTEPDPISGGGSISAVADGVGMPGRVMGVLNVTPDSFSDGGLFTDLEAALAHVGDMIDEGAAVIDVGGESTRPGADPVDAVTEQQRVIPAIGQIRERWPDIEISVDTSKPAVARAAVAAGATIINDVSASLEQVAADTGSGWIAMHSPGPSKTMQDNPCYDDVVAEVAAFLESAAERARSLGVERVWVDPGFGFGKTLDHNLALMAALDRFVAIAPTVVGVSRKTSIGQLHAAADSARSLVPCPQNAASPLAATATVDDRIEGSLVMAVWALHLGADMVRVHDVRDTVHALSVLPPVCVTSPAGSPPAAGIAFAGSPA